MKKITLVVFLLLGTLCFAQQKKTPKVDVDPSAKLFIKCNDQILKQEAKNTATANGYVVVDDEKTAKYILECSGVSYDDDTSTFRLSNFIATTRLLEGEKVLSVVILSDTYDVRTGVQTKSLVKSSINKTNGLFLPTPKSLVTVSSDITYSVTINKQKRGTLDSEVAGAIEQVLIKNGRSVVTKSSKTQIEISDATYTKLALPYDCEAEISIIVVNKDKPVGSAVFKNKGEYSCFASMFSENPKNELNFISLIEKPTFATKPTSPLDQFFK